MDQQTQTSLIPADYVYGVVTLFEDSTSKSKFANIDTYMFDTFGAAINHAEEKNDRQDLSLLALVRVNRTTGQTDTLYNAKQLNNYLDDLAEEREREEEEVRRYGTCEDQARAWYFENQL